MFTATLGIVFGLIYWKYVLFLFQLLFGKLLKYPAVKIEIFGWDGHKYNENEKRRWHKVKRKVMPIVSFAMRKGPDREKLLVFGPYAASLLIHLIPFIIIRTSYGSGAYNEGIGFFTTLTLFMSVLMLVAIILCAVSINKPINKELTRLYKEQIYSLWNGASFSQINVYQGLTSDKSASGHLRALHLNMCIYKALDRGDYQILPQYLQALDEILLTPNGYNTAYNFTSCYYNILFYSSYIYINPQNAMKIYSLIKETIENDMQAYGSRILAYYQYFILKRPDLAAASLFRAEEALKKANMDIYTEAEMNLDRKYIKELRNRMAGDSLVQSSENPVMRYEQ